MVKKNEITDVDLGMDKIVKGFKDIKGSFVKVGLQGEKGTAIHKESKSLSVVDVGVYNEFGTDKIPERSFTRATFDLKQKDWRKMNAELIQKLIGSKQSIAKILDIMGLKLVADMKNRIRKGISPINAPITLARKEKKRAKGSKGKVKPLIDTGQMLSAITYSKVKK